jgi:hypothetical protein
VSPQDIIVESDLSFAELTDADLSEANFIQSYPTQWRHLNTVG